MLLLALNIVLQSNPALLYEQKCTYCHSDEMSQHPDYSAEGWARTVERMRGKARLLITRSDARELTAYIQTALHLKPVRSVKPVVTPPPAGSGEGQVRRPTHVFDSAPLPLPPSAEVPDTAEEVHDEKTGMADEQGAALMAARCSKCHSLNRVFNKLDSLERSLSTLDRMKTKTGAAITKEDAKRLEQFLRAQFATAPD